MKNDFWYLPITCYGCGQAGNGNKKEPISLLDVCTELCEYCFEESQDKDDETKKQKAPDQIKSRAPNLEST